jgi:hypothetical protein
MASSGQLGDTPASMSSPYLDSTKESRNALDTQPSLEKFIEFAGAIAKTLDGQFRFLEEDSEPDDPSRIREHMMQEMKDLWHTRQGLLADLRQYFINEYIMTNLSGVVKEKPNTMNTCLEELDSIRTAVKTTLGNAIRAAQDDLSSEHVSSAQRQESRTAALGSLQDLAMKWTTLSEVLSSVTIIGAQQHLA